MKDLREKTTVAELCRKEGINQNTYYRWSKDFTPADKKRFKSDTEREAITNEVQGLRKENSNLKHLVAVLSLKNN